MAQPLLSIRGVTKDFPMGKTKVRALRGVDLEVQKGEFAVVFGPSGSGKSTLLGLIAGLEKPTAGEIMVAGQDINQLKPDDSASYRRNKIGMVFQQFNLITTLSARDNIALPLLLSGIKRKEALQRANQLLKIIGLEKRTKHKPTELSGGEQQRVAFGRALVANPSILLVDEPTGNLDAENSQEIIRILMRLHEWKRTVVLVTHNPEFLKYADKTFTIDKGRIVHSQVNKAQTAQQSPIPESVFKYQATPSRSKGMRFWEILRLARAHFASKKSRTFFTASGVALGIGSIVALVSLGVGFQQITSSQLATINSLVTITVSATEHTLHPLDDEAVGKIAEIKNVALVSPSITTPAKVTLGQTTTPVILTGLQREALDFEGIELIEGNSDGVVLSKSTAKSFDVEDYRALLGRELFLELLPGSLEQESEIANPLIETAHAKIKISGVSSEELISSVYLPLDKVKEITGATAYSNVKVKVANRPQVAGVRDEIEKLGYSTSSVVDLIKQVDRVFLIAQIILGLIGSIALIVALLGIVNTMTIALLERTHEIGIMKALGASNDNIKKIFACEAGLFGLVGGIFGVSMAWLIGQGINGILNYLIKASQAGPPMYIFITPKLFVIEMVILSVLVALIAGWYPSRRAAKLSAMESLRYE